MKRFCFCALSSVFILTAPPGARSANPEWEQATKLYTSGNYASALPAFRKLAEKSPKDPSIHYMIGQCYKGLSKPQQANVEFNWVAQYSTDPKTKAMAQGMLKASSPAASSPGAASSTGRGPMNFINDSASQTISEAAKAGWVPCRGGCLNFATPGWHHEKVTGHPDSDMWMTYNYVDPAGGSGTRTYNQFHIGHIINAPPDKPAEDVGPCQHCGGTGWIKSR